MKRHASSDSLGALISICPLAEDEQSGANKVAVYGRELECVMEEEAYMEEEETGQVRGKKRRLSAVQVKALEKKFEVENKLEPERKVKLALELGLQPRQVAVWFQNRRARWKTKQLERDYGVLKATYDSLKDNFDSLHQANQLLLLEIAELKTKMMNGESVKEAIEEGPSDSDSSAILNSPSGTATHPAAPVHQYVKMEEHDFFSEETCNFYSEDQAPTLHWWTSTSSLLDQD